MFAPRSILIHILHRHSCPYLCTQVPGCLDARLFERILSDPGSQIPCCQVDTTD